MIIIVYHEGRGGGSSGLFINKKALGVLAVIVAMIYLSSL
jgi:hypothetical protein